MMKKLNYKYYNKRITTIDNGNLQSHDQEESKLNSTINTNSGADTLTNDKNCLSLKSIKKQSLKNIHSYTYKIVHLTLSLITTGSMLISLFYLPHQNI